MHLPIPRIVKAVDLVGAFDRLLDAANQPRNAASWAIVAAGLEQQPDAFWRDLADRAGVRPPSDPADAVLGVSRPTRDLVVAVYRERGELRGAA